MHFEKIRMLWLLSLLIAGAAFAFQPGLAQAVAVPVPSEEARLHSVVGYFAFFWNTFYSVILLLLVLFSGASAKLRDWINGQIKRTWLQCVLFLLLFGLLIDLAYVPESFVSGYLIPHYFKLSSQSFSSWLTDFLKLELITLDSFVEGYAILFLLIRKRKKTWPIWICAYQLIMGAITSFLYPSVLAPIFNHYEPMENCSLRDKIETLVRETQLELDIPILISDASTRTTSANAQVEGFGPTARIVVWDNTIKKMPENEIVAILAHEIGHYRMHHVYWLFLSSALLNAVFVPVYMLYARKLTALLPPRCGVNDLGDWAVTPGIMMVCTLVFFISEPISNGFSRFIENQADEYALRITRDGPVYAKAMIDLGSLGLSDPNVHPFIEFWLFSHPSISKRVERANLYTAEHR